MEMIKAQYALTERQYQQIEAYLKILIKWNAVYRLVGNADPDYLWRFHVADSLAVNTLIGDFSKLADLGTGAGLPGIIIKIMHPDREVVLVDSLTKRCNFCREVKRELGLKKLTIVDGRADSEEIVHRTGPCDVVISRAVWQLREFGAIGSKFLQAGGRLLAMKGDRHPEEIADFAITQKYTRLIGPEIFPYGVSFENRTHYLVEYILNK